jgi:NAD-dependent DNA ligase
LYAGEFSPLIQNLWLGTDDADALATALKPQLDVTKKQAEVLLEEVIRLQVALNEGIDVQALAPLEQQSTQHLPGTMIGQTVAFSGFRDVTWESQIMALGGNISKTTVTRSTTILVVHNLHADPTRKVELAKQYGIKIISRPDFGMMLANAQSQSKSA